MNKNALSFFVSWLLTRVRLLENMIFENENQYACRHSALAMSAKWGLGRLDYNSVEIVVTPNFQTNKRQISKCKSVIFPKKVPKTK